MYSIGDGRKLSRAKLFEHLPWLLINVDDKKAIGFFCSRYLGVRCRRSLDLLTLFNFWWYVSKGMLDV